MNAKGSYKSALAVPSTSVLIRLTSILLRHDLKALLPPVGEKNRSRYRHVHRVLDIGTLCKQNGEDEFLQPVCYLILSAPQIFHHTCKDHECWPLWTICFPGKVKGLKDLHEKLVWVLKRPHLSPFQKVWPNGLAHREGRVCWESQIMD